MGKIRNEILIVLLFVFSSCDNPLDSRKIVSKANAGEDQATYVGSYAIFDPTKSTLAESDIVELIEYIQDPNNPQEISIPTYSSLTDKFIAGFHREGTYKFILTIKCKNGNILKDDIVVTVNRRQEGLIEDINLEIQIRYRLKYKDGVLTSNRLQLLDSLSVGVSRLYSNKIISINGIEFCENMTYLNLPVENITDIKSLSDLTKLETIYLYHNYIEDISPLYNLTNLKKLILYSNPITDISGLSNLTKLTELFLWDTPISDISSLSSLINLEVLYIDGVGINVNFNSIGPLKNLTNLKRLEIAGRGISDIKPLENLTELIMLGLSYNSLTEISSVYKMKKLIRLYIRKNKVKNLSGIKNLENLDYLDAADNQIKDITELQYLPKIHLIGLSGNKIEDIAPLVNNPNLGEGVYLYLGGNPLNEKSLNEYIPVLIARGVTVYMM